MIFIFILILLAAVVGCMRPYNYERFNLWNFIAICGNVWLAVLTILAIFTEIRKINLIAAMLGGFIVMIIFGYLI